MEHGIPTLNMLEGFRRAGETPLYYARDMHWTPSGHRVAANAICAFLERESLLGQAVGNEMRTGDRRGRSSDEGAEERPGGSHASGPVAEPVAARRLPGRIRGGRAAGMGFGAGMSQVTGPIDHNGKPIAGNGRPGILLGTRSALAGGGQ